MEPIIKIDQGIKVLIIGAGAAGIGAARRLLEFGIKPIILEGRDRGGGRCYTSNFKGIPIDLGAAWVHSINPENSIYNEIKRMGYPLKEEKTAEAYLDEDKGLLENSISVKQGTHWNILQKKQIKAEDCSLFELIKEDLEEVKRNQSEIENRVLDVLITRKEQYYGDCINVLSSHYYEYVIEPECESENIVPSGGYGALLAKLSEGLEIKYNQNVTKIQYKTKEVSVYMEEGGKFDGDLAIVTLPLGVLKNNSVIFDPALPQEKIEAIGRLGNGLANKIFLKFKNNFWGDNLKYFRIASEEKERFTCFYCWDNKENVLCSFVNGPFARKIEKMSDLEIIQLIMEHLKRTFKKTEEIELEDYLITRWGQDKWCLGSYSFFKYGSTPKDCDNLKKEVLGTIFFAGEACFKENIGVCHGAYKTGVEAANKIIEILKTDYEKRKEFN